MLWLWFDMLEICGTVKRHAFIVGDKTHRQSEKIYTMLNSLAKQMEKGGYVADTYFVLDDVEEEAKEDMLHSHSERLGVHTNVVKLESVSLAPKIFQMSKEGQGY